MHYTAVKYRGNSRLRNDHLDTDCYVSELEQNSKCKLSNPIFKNFFYRTTFVWNKLPCDIRDISNTISFKVRVKQFLWETENARCNIEIC